MLVVVMAEVAIERRQNHSHHRLALAGISSAAIWVFAPPDCRRQA